MCRGGYQPPAWKPSIRCICETKCPLQENSEEEMNLFGVFSFAKTFYHSERSAAKSNDLPRPAAGEGLILPASLPRARGRWREAPDEVPIRRMTDEVLRSPPRVGDGVLDVPLPPLPPSLREVSVVDLPRDG